MPDFTFLASHGSDIITCIVGGARNGGELDRFYGFTLVWSRIHKPVWQSMPGYASL